MMRPSALSRDDFVRRFGAVYEHSPWFAEAVWDAGAPDDEISLRAALREAVESASRGARLALIRAHPDLAGRIALSAESSAEQKGAGLDQCSSEEFAAFQELNAAYTEKFGFPFIIAVRGLSRAQILDAFRQRIANDSEAEFATALEQIHRIAAFRLHDLFGGT